ncbi:aldehyde dehydrogenase family protein [Granulosicoccus antarcticus]|uniref:Aldehyde dehydrogenase AldA n=1 Tax=Granulosicoccus antarcticus IMCC3135 TaxID=1192854 RepID=A0A2Z2NSY4_9GAMM|nr:aldehyde dehydrogenase family protein [Granulosicoccus antarcticus]ASJ74409.1 Putative aldehyde dehydrogenase AldA [Granulosicoccus antarcticus IMCC3135]
MNVAHYFDTMSYGSAPESDSEARQWLAAHQDGFGHFINGRFTAPSEVSFTTLEPATGEVLATLSEARQDDVDAAVKAARAAQPAWAALPGHSRAKVLYALARIIQRHARLIAVVEALDSGKPVRETRDIDIPLAIRHFYHHAGWAQLQSSEFPDHSPIGVVGQIIPWNFPFLMMAWKIAPALALGNTVVLKPAEYTPLSALLFAELTAKAGLPEGVLNIVTGNGAAGALLAVHEQVDKVAFTGSTAVGKWIRQATAGSGKSLTLELGGKSPFIVFEDADLDAAVEGVVDAIWFNQGQVCCAGSRILVQEGIAEDFHSRLRERMSRLRVGQPLDKCIDMGSLVAPVQFDRVQAMVQQAVAAGASLYQPEIEMPSGGSFYPPTLLSDADPSSAIMCEEVFGPVVVSMSFRTFDEAIAVANHTRYGLSASIWSESINQSLEVAAAVQAGIVWINTTNVMDAGVGFGGKKESGFGREGGREGCFDYLKPDAWMKAPMRKDAEALPIETSRTAEVLDRTAKLYIGGRQVRPDGNYSRAVVSPRGVSLGDVGEGNRKDIRNAVEAARKATSWARTTTHNRAQILYFLAENLSIREAEFASRIRQMTGVTMKQATAEVEASVSRLFTYGAWADKYEGAVHQPPIKGMALAVPEAQGVVGLICPPESPLLAMISLLAPQLASGNCSVIVPSESSPLSATDFYQILETSDVPAGVVNIVTGNAMELADTLSKHNDVDALWAFAGPAITHCVEENSTGNLKRIWSGFDRQIDWLDPIVGEGREYLNRATDIKNIWVPYGE